MEMLGDPVRMDMFCEKPLFITFKTQISRSVHVPGDPRLDCAVYTKDNSYHKCVKKDLINTFTKEIGCVPPLLEDDPKLICNRKFNVPKKRDNEINKIFRSFYYHDRKFNCRTPCTKNIYTSRFVHSAPSRFKSNTLVLIFDKTIEVGRSSFSIDGQTLMTRLGGSVSSGRTLIWIILTILSASQVGFNHFNLISRALIDSPSCAGSAKVVSRFRVVFGLLCLLQPHVCTQQLICSDTNYSFLDGIATSPVTVSQSVGDSFRFEDSYRISEHCELVTC